MKITCLLWYSWTKLNNRHFTNGYADTSISLPHNKEGIIDFKTSSHLFNFSYSVGGCEAMMLNRYGNLDCVLSSVDSVPCQPKISFVHTLQCFVESNYTRNVAFSNRICTTFIPHLSSRQPRYTTALVGSSLKSMSVGVNFWQQQTMPIISVIELTITDETGQDNLIQSDETQLKFHPQDLCFLLRHQ